MYAAKWQPFGATMLCQHEQKIMIKVISGCDNTLIIDGICKYFLVEIK